MFYFFILPDLIKCLLKKNSVIRATKQYISIFLVNICVYFSEMDYEDYFLSKIKQPTRLN